MGLIELQKVGRFYQIGKNKKKYVLKDVSLSFPHRGLMTILGKSGSGKSTLLNMIGKIDEPSEGLIFFDDENISKLKEKKLARFRAQLISFVFQHYHLLDRQTALYNVMLPALISGVNQIEAKREAIRLLNDFSIGKDLFNKRCADLSGGERERIAIARAFINKPRVILADEPTGALDKSNAVLVMKALKNYSQESLVIMVTHNQELAKQYSDRIIYMHDGKIVKDERLTVVNNKAVNQKKKKHRPNSGWLSKIVSSNFSKRFKRNIFSVLSITIGIVASTLIVGFANGKDLSITKSMEKQFDYGSLSINKENKISSNNSPITLIQTRRPNRYEMEEISEICGDFHVCYSYDALISPYPEILINEAKIEDASYLPVYSFVDSSCNHDLLYKGKIPLFDTLNQVVINKRAYQSLNKKLNYDCLNTYLRIKDQHSYSYYTDEVDRPYVTDYFVFDRLVQIVGVVDEITFLNTPKIYYSYLALDKYMEETILNNLSSLKEEITWKERVANASDNEAISAYMCRMFLKDSDNLHLLKSLEDELPEYAITSNALTIESTLFSLVEAASVGMEVFLAIALVGIIMIISIVSYASYNEDIKDSAILLCLGAKRDDIAMIYVTENVLLGFISVFLSFVVSILVCNPINRIIQNYTSLIDIISLPLLKFHNHGFLFPILVLVVTMFVCVLSTYIPIAFSKKISLKEELKDND